MERIRARYEGNTEFRQYADRYLADFDRLLADAKGAEHEELLTSAFITADIGKIYMLLRESVGRSAAA